MTSRIWPRSNSPKRKITRLIKPNASKSYVFALVLNINTFTYILEIKMIYM